MTADTIVQSLRSWSYHRQGLAGGSGSLSATLERVIAVYSSRPTAPLSLLARNESADARGFGALERERLAVRLPAMRASIFLMPVSSAPRLLAATRTPLEKHSSRLEYAGLTWADYARIRERFLEQVTTPKSTEELQDLIPVDGKLMVAIRLLAYEGLALRVGDSLRSDAFSYVSAISWLGEPLAQPDPEESLAWLATEYLRAFGPATVADFAWWAGITKTRAREAVTACDTREVAAELLLLVDDIEEWECHEPLCGDEVAVLPKWDAYTMGYPADGRARFVDERELPMAYPKVSATSGDGAPLILRGGKAVASWAHRFSGDRLIITMKPFDSGDRLDWMPRTAFERVGVILGASDISVKSGSD